MSLSLKQEQPEVITVGNMKFTESQLKALHSGVLKVFSAVHDLDNPLVFTPSETAVWGKVMFDIERAGIVNTYK
ncbi:hypothetical protein [Paenibacillus sp. NAIST15-1]|uniref:hypothetical protein n=1 Tax=Paenibacillus sp. NAIST15-1 TaxID=1605994 RepID=UPI00086F04C6|nr:hypothetical protein [Paenibacillus sp. NAIST15-1]GAV11467.1 hypothetical protein PBN151_1396 [Paenibacillus sp. NAIST15-1]